jgi:ABC-type multidrug transport system fused ATPase/permease subunit
VKYNGKVGYLPQKLWFQNSTARSNILFGEPINSKKLGKVYRMLGIEDEMSLLNKADLTLMNETSNISDGQKRRIALARVLYS